MRPPFEHMPRRQMCTAQSGLTGLANPAISEHFLEMENRAVQADAFLHSAISVHFLEMENRAGQADALLAFADAFLQALS
jgi:hypothetical protein